VRRRTFVGLTGASLFGAVLASSAPDAAASGVERLAAVLAGYSPDVTVGGLNAQSELPALSVAVAKAKSDYQACRYTDVINSLPGLLMRAQARCAALIGERQAEAYALLAEAYHVAASVLLKLGDHGLAWLAADRSLQAARASGDPLTVGCSARIITHALTSSGYHRAGASTAKRFAEDLDRDMPVHDRESWSVYGSLLLRGAVAAAQDHDRRTAHELLAEAEDAGHRVGSFSTASTSMPTLRCGLPGISLPRRLPDARPCASLSGVSSPLLPAVSDARLKASRVALEYLRDRA